MNPTATPLRAMYVEDSATDADLARRALLRASPPVELDLVTSVAAAIDQLNRQPTAYDWVLFDLNLPDGDGLQVLNHVRQQELPVVTMAITGTGDERAVVNALKMGVDDYVIKTGAYLDHLHQLLMDARDRTQQSQWRTASQIRVLYVEDSMQDSALTAHYLRQHARHIQLQIINAPFNRLTEQLDAGAFDVLLLDFRLDNLDTFELVKHIKRGPHRHVPVVIITGHGSEHTAAQVLRMGVTDYVIKDSGYLQRLPWVLESACMNGQLQHERLRLQRSEAQLMKLTSQVPGAIVLMRMTTSGDLHPEYATDTLSKVQGISLQEFTDGALPDRVHPDDKERVRACAGKAVEQGQVLSCEYRIRMQACDTTSDLSDNWRWFETQMSPEPQPDGSTLLYCYTFDITERRLMQELALTTQTAIRANQAKTEFLSHMSHELRTPLNAVLGFAQLLRSDTRHALSDDQQHHVKHIEQAGQHLLHMINEVLNLARIEAGEISLSPELIDPLAICDEAVSLLSPLAGQRDIQVVLHQPTANVVHASQALSVFADPTRLRQIVVNLLSNGIKYNKARGRVDLVVAQLADQVSIQVKDTGIGMSPAQQSHLFEPFNRLGADRTDIEGTGIGLVIVRKLVELMGGQLLVVSTPGDGSMFEVRMPMGPQAMLEHTPHPARHEPGLTATAPTVQRTILYAEDDAINIELVRQIMALRLTYQLKVATSGAEAIEMALADPPDLLLLDMHLGDMDGIAVSDALRTDPRLSDIPRVALSANALPEQIERAQAHGFVDYLTKPLNVSKFVDCMNKHMTKAATPIARP